MSDIASNIKPIDDCVSIDLTLDDFSLDEKIAIYNLCEKIKFSNKKMAIDIGYIEDIYIYKDKLKFLIRLF